MFSNPFPLLGKDLIELANRRNLYFLRTIYASVLFCIGLYILFGNPWDPSYEPASVVSELGTGGPLFRQIVILQIAAILMFVPAMSASVITSEKERDTLLLLLITPMSPIAIVFQKMLARVVPVLCYIILSFPLLAVAYSRGGVTTFDMLGSMVLLTMLVVQVASVGVMCSAYCRTSVEAFFATYLFLGMSTFCCPCNMIWIELFQRATLGPAQLVAGPINSLFLSVACLLAAQVWLVQRAFVPGRNWILILFQKLDGMYQEMNHVVGGVVLVNDRNNLPETRPIAWRETSRKSLGTFRYLFRVLVVLEVPILICLTTVHISIYQSNTSMSTLLYLLWVISLTLITIHAAGVVSSERTRQTLESLLTVPLSGPEILLQKISGVKRLIFVLLVPFGSIFLINHWMFSYGWDLRYLFISLAATVSILWCAAWFAFWVGLNLRSQMRAVVLSLAGVCVMLVIPTVWRVVTEQLLGYRYSDWNSWVPLENMFSRFSFDPARLILELEGWSYRNQYDQGKGLDGLAQIAVIHCAILAGVWYFLRTLCLSRADRLLCRVSERDYRPEPLPGESIAVEGTAD